MLKASQDTDVVGLVDDGVGCANSDMASELAVCLPWRGSVAPHLTVSEATWMLSKLAYLTLCRSIQLLVLLARGEAAKDLEILVGAVALPDQGRLKA
jgi:hypothetical protein